MLVSGMIIGTVFTLFVVPSIYMLVAKTHTAFHEEPAEEKFSLGEPVEAGV
jgi:multidrug efflux pump